MEPIQSSLQRFANDSRIQERLQTAKKELLSDSFVQKALTDLEEVNEEMIDQGMVKLFDYKKEWHQCTACPGLDACPNMLQGYQPELVVTRESLDLHYHPCSLKVEDEQQKRQNQLMKSLYIPKDILSARFELLDVDEDRDEAGAAALEFALSAKPGENGEGLYFCGKFGVGKTFMMGAIANALKERRIESFLVYTPDFFREMKQSIGDGTFQEKMDAIKQAQVLILDDIGAESISAWIRDDVLGAILQYRMLEKLPTLFTSNYDYDELENHLAYSDRGGTEELKAKRIMERIKHFTTLVMVKGRNRRSQK